MIRPLSWGVVAALTLLSWHSGAGVAVAAQSFPMVTAADLADTGSHGSVKVTVTSATSDGANTGCVGLVSAPSGTLVGARCQSQSGVFTFPSVPPASYHVQWLPSSGTTPSQFAGGLSRLGPQPTVTVTKGKTSTASMALVARPSPFPDVNHSNPFVGDIASLTEKFVIRGYDDGTFRPSGTASRQAFAAYLARALHWNGVVPSSASTRFPDVPATHPFGDDINWLAARGTIGGYDDGTFGPTRTVTRQAAAALLAREIDGFSSFKAPSKPTFPDVSAKHPLYPEIEYAAHMGLVNGYDDGRFLPARAISRQAIAAFVERFVVQITGRTSSQPVGVQPSYGQPLGHCLPGNLGNGALRQCVDFPSGARAFIAPTFTDSFGHAPPPASAVLEGGYVPRAGECSTQTHDRYWTTGQDGKVYRTWHPTWTFDIGTGRPCTFGHEHGDNPQTSAMYMWAGGVPFGITNAVAMSHGVHRHEDHHGHKIVVQNDYPVIVGNPPDNSSAPMQLAGFHCNWLSKVHQGTHSGDAFTHNLHEYQNSILCDDGAARKPDADIINSGHWANARAGHHTEASARGLTPWGEPGNFKACDREERITLGSPSDGAMPPGDSDTDRKIPCATASESWTHKLHPRQITSHTGHIDFAPRDAGAGELWKPWLSVTSQSGNRVYVSSPYYLVRNPARVYNDGSLVPRRDVNGDGTVDHWIPALDVCLALKDLGRTHGQCANLPSFPSNVPRSQWWTLPESPFNGSIRAVHPKGIAMWNFTSQEVFCTDHLGQETSARATLHSNETWTCPAGTLTQRIAPTVNLWSAQRASWGPQSFRGQIDGSAINAQKNGSHSGFAHEWVRFFDDPGIHAPN